MSTTSQKALCDLGNVYRTETIKNKYKFEEKVYPIEDSIFLQRATFAQTQILRHALIDGEVRATDFFDPQNPARRPYVTFHTDVKAGTKKRLYRDEILSNGWYSEVTGYPADACGFIGKSTKREVQIDKYICTKKVRQEEQVCIPTMIGTWQQDQLAAGALREDSDIFLSDALVYAMLKQNRIGIDTHAWAGNYKSADKYTMHTDGFIKVAVNGMDSVKPAIYTHTISGLDATVEIKGLVGGMEYTVDFNTTNNQTLDDWVAKLLTMKYADGRNIFAAATHDDAGTVTITTQDGELYDHQFVISEASGDLVKCYDGTIKAETPPATASVTVTNTVVQDAESGDSPIGIDKVVITPVNVVDRIIKLQEAINETRSWILNPDFGGTLFVAPNVWHALRIALVRQTEAFKGTQTGWNDQDGYLPNFLDFNIVRANYMPSNEMLYARSQDLHVGTDLISDIEEIRTGYDPKEGQGWFKQAMTIGFQISELANVAGTFCNRPSEEFTDLMPCENAYGTINVDAGAKING